MTDLPDFVEINEEGPREGFQIEPGPISTSDKIKLIDALSETGLKNIQTCSFVNPRLVPGWADAEAVVEGFTPTKGIKYSGLYFNGNGLDRALKYKDKLISTQKRTGESDALLVFKGNIDKIPVITCIFEYSFFGGSMGSVVGEKFSSAIKICIDEKKPLICFSASGGARMQESLFSLFQMAKTSASLNELSSEGLPYISVLTDPTMGGVSASLAMLGDINIAEPNALIGFAGPRVIEQTVGEKLPKGFQKSEFLQDHGSIDFILDRNNQKNKLAQVISSLMSNYNSEKKS